MNKTQQENDLKIFKRHFPYSESVTKVPLDWWNVRETVRRLSENKHYQATQYANSHT